MMNQDVKSPLDNNPFLSHYANDRSDCNNNDNDDKFNTAISSFASNLDHLDDISCILTSFSVDSNNYMNDDKSNTKMSSFVSNLDDLDDLSCLSTSFSVDSNNHTKCENIRLCNDDTFSSFLFPMTTEEDVDETANLLGGIPSPNNSNKRRTIKHQSDDNDNNKKNNKRRKMQHHSDDEGDDNQQDFATTTVVTPEIRKIATIDLATNGSFTSGVENDPVIQSLFLDHCNYGSNDTKNGNKENEEEQADLLSLCSIDPDPSITATATNLSFNPSVFHENSYSNHYVDGSGDGGVGCEEARHRGNNNSGGSVMNENSNNLFFDGGDLRNGEVYRILRPLLPLDESLQLIVGLLLHMELSSKLSTARSSDSLLVVKDACNIVYVELKQSQSDTPHKKDVTKGAEWSQKLLGDIVEKLIDKLESSVDFYTFFKTLALSDNRNEVLIPDTARVIFFQPERIKVDAQNEVPAVVRTTSTPRILSKPKRRKRHSITATNAAAQTRSSHDDNRSTTNNIIRSKNRHLKGNCEVKMINKDDRILQLAIAYGATYYNDNLTSSSSSLVTKEEQRGEERSRPKATATSLEEFVTNTCDKLERMDFTQIQNLWNNMMN